MRQKTFNFAGQRFASLAIEAEGGGSLERQSQALFEQASAERVAAQGLALDQNVVRSRVFGRGREARDVVSGVRGRRFEGTGRAATSSYISPGYFSSAADVGIDLFAMAAPPIGTRKVSEHTPVQPFIRHLTWGPMGVPRRHDLRDAADAARAIYRRARGGRRSCSPRPAATGTASCTSPFPCTGAKTRRRCSMASPRLASVPLDNCEVEQVDGYSRPGKLIEIEITAKR